MGDNSDIFLLQQNQNQVIALKYRINDFLNFQICFESKINEKKK